MAVDSAHIAHFDVTRVLRTPHSERFVLLRHNQEFAALELHYLLNGTVAGTVIIYQDAQLQESEIPSLLTQIDDRLLPEVDISEHNLFFTVVVGKVLGSFQPEVEAVREAKS